MSDYPMLAKTLYNLEDQLSQELKELGAGNIVKRNRAVSFTGDKRLMYEANLKLRTALSILKPIEKFFAFDPDRLYRRAKHIEWDQYFSADKTILIDSVSFGKNFPHSQFAALRLKDSIADYFMAKYKRRPSVDKQNPDVRINLHIVDKQCRISLDSSGQTLDKRGYRTEHTEAPMNEVLAAGLLMASNATEKDHIHDPMCGSGTIAIEAAMMAADIAPGFNRHFSFEHWSDFDTDLLHELKAEARRQQHKPKIKITASDLDMRAVEVTLRNATRAKVDKYMDIKNMDFFQSYPKAENGLLIMNPPYGERLEKDEQMPEFYKKIGDHLKQHYAGWEARVFSGNLHAIKLFGLKPSEKQKFYNGALECRLHRYDLYSGSKKREI
ncbi:MAG: THUMP domain-containing class I SAM-dependent RNA methyltransferase [Bacteroidota bacterium]